MVMGQWMSWKWVWGYLKIYVHNLFFSIKGSRGRNGDAHAAMSWTNFTPRRDLCQNISILKFDCEISLILTRCHICRSWSVVHCIWKTTPIRRISLKITVYCSIDICTLIDPGTWMCMCKWLVPEREREMFSLRLREIRLHVPHKILALPYWPGPP